MTAKAHTVLVDGTPLPLKIKRNPLARRISLRLAPDGAAAVLVVPPGARIGEAVAFAHSRGDWLAARRAALPARISFQDGAEVPLQGIPHLLRAAPPGQRGVSLAGQVIVVPGLPEHFARRTQDWLIGRARTEISERVYPLAAHAGHRIARLRITDPTSRWGSASSTGVLSFSWRLILAPAAVLDYVIAHEVAHLDEMNHSPAFWRIVATLTTEVEPAKAWLKRHGRRLHLYG